VGGGKKPKQKVTGEEKGERVGGDGEKAGGREPKGKGEKGCLGKRGVDVEYQKEKWDERA